MGTGVDKRVVDMVAFRKKWENSELEENERATLYLDAATSKSGTLFLPRNLTSTHSSYLKIHTLHVGSFLN